MSLKPLLDFDQLGSSSYCRPAYLNFSRCHNRSALAKAVVANGINHSPLLREFRINLVQVVRLSAIFATGLVRTPRIVGALDF
jgi:hypothetical protein